MERRDFIQKLSVVLAGLALNPENLFSNTQADPEGLWFTLVDYARWSPSPHNIQPWKIKVISGTEAELHYSIERLFPVADTDNRFSYIAMGVFIENLAIVASNLGSELDFTSTGIPISANKSSDTKLGNISLKKTKSVPIFDKELIKKRKTSRLHYQPCAVKDDVLKNLQKIAENFGHSFEFSSDEKLVEKILELNRDALFIDLNNEGIRKELDTWLRYNKKDAEEKKDGLWSHCMNFPGKLMKNFFHHPHFYNHGLVKKVIDKYYLNTMDGTKTIAWIKGKTGTPDERINAGRMLAQLWLELTKHNAYLHPFGSVITNEVAHSTFKDLISEQTDELWFLVRLGYSKDPPQSYRLNTNELFI